MGQPKTLRAMVLDRPRAPLALRELPVPVPGPGQILIRIAACGVCRTDLHIVDGDLANPKLPLVLGHEIAGRVVECGTATRCTRRSLVLHPIDRAVHRIRTLKASALHEEGKMRGVPESWSHSTTLRATARQYEDGKRSANKDAQESASVAADAVSALASIPSQ